MRRTPGNIEQFTVGKPDNDKPLQDFLAACGHKDKDGSLVVVWHFLGGTRHGRYRCRIKE